MAVRYLVTGCAGQLGAAFMRRLGNDAEGLDLPELDITDIDSVMSVVRAVDPMLIINCAAVTDVDLCQRQPRLAMTVHRDGVQNLTSTGRRLITFSTDHVFSGAAHRNRPFLEDDRTQPVNSYALSKLEGEKEALSCSSDNMVIRTSWLWKDHRGLVPFLWNSLQENGSVRAVSDQIANAAYAPDVVEAVLEIADRGGSGIFHVVNRGEFSPAGIAGMICSRTFGEVIPVTWQQLELDAPRPQYSALESGRGVELPELPDAIDRWRRAVE